MLGFAILLGFNLLGVLLQTVFNLPIPGNVIGLILFIVALFLKIVKLEWVEVSAQFLVRHMMLLFAPFVVGVVVFLPLISEQWTSIVISLIVSTLLVLCVSGWVTSLLSSKEEESHDHG